MLKIQNLNSGHNGIRILKNINLNVKPGEIVVIIGPNGSGKTTLLKSIFNLCEIYSGKIFWLNKNITRMPSHKLINEGISYVSQGRQIFKTLTVKENLEMGAFVAKDKKLVNTGLKKIFRKFPFLKDKKNDYAFTLSGGQQQMLAIGCVLMQYPRVLLLDEPSLGLSPKSMKEIFKEIKKINKLGVTIIIVEQNFKSAIKIADKTYVLEDGGIRLVRKP